MVRNLPHRPPIYDLSPLFTAEQIVDGWLRQRDKPGLFALVDLRTKALWRANRVAPSILDAVIRRAGG